MRIDLVCFGAMREHLPDPSAGRARLEIASGATVRDVVAAIGAPEARVFSVLVDGERASLDKELYEDAEITLMPPFAGGLH